MPKSRQRYEPKLPEVNLIPMMNVMMAILAFFVMISAMLGSGRGMDVALTGGKNQPGPTTPENLPEPLIVELNAQGQRLINQQALSPEQLTAQIQAYLASNPKGAVLLQASRSLPYQQVISVLGEMQDVGGDRVSLALDNLLPAPTTEAASSAAVQAQESAPVTNQPAAPTEGTTGGAPVIAPAAAPPVDVQPAAPVVIPSVPEDYDS
jgi:biopolymer transport protein ExbD